MNKETLEKANELNKKITSVKNIITDLNKGDLAICGWCKGGYRGIVELTDDEINYFINKQKIKLVNLEKELEEL